MKKYLMLFSVLFFIGCQNITKEEIQVVQNFNISRYVGTWYEIARFDHSFERGLELVSANYTLNDDGTVKVLNKGFNTKKNEWKQAKGRAKFADKLKPKEGRLKVSFFWPFYGDYNIIILDTNYQYAVVTGRSKDYLWILSRNKKMDKMTLNKLVSKIKQMGFETDNLMYIKQ